MNRLSTALVLLLLAGASAGCRLLIAGLTAEGSAVRIAKPEAVGHCRELGPVHGGALGGGFISSEEKLRSAQNELRNETASQGGNYVTVDKSATFPDTVDLQGRAFRCEGAPREESPQTAAAVASPQPTVPAPSAEQRLLQLRELLDKGLVTQDEYQRRRGEILQSL